MQKENVKLNRFIEAVTRGDASAIQVGEEMGGERVWSGEIAEINEPTFRFYMADHSGPPKMKQNDWFIFSDAKTVAQPGILFWQMKEKYFARRLDPDQWEEFIDAAKIKKMYW